MSIVKVRIGKQGNRGAAGTAAPETIAVNAALSSVLNVSNNVTAVQTVASNIVDIQAVATSITAIVSSLPVNVKDFGAIGDGQAHPLSNYYTTLADAQVAYPQATALTDELDGTALRKAIAYCITNNRTTIYTPSPSTANGYYRFNTFIDFPYVIGGRNGCINFIGPLGSADNRTQAPHWVRTVSAAGFRFIGRSLMVTGYNALIIRVNMKNITLNGGWGNPGFDTNADYPVLYADAGYEFFWDDAVITQALGGVFLREVMDSRFNNIRLTWCGQKHGYQKDLTMTNGSATATVTSTTGLYVGQRIYGTGVQLVRISAIVNSTTLTLSTNANYTGTRKVSFEAKAALTIGSNNTNEATSNNQVWTGFRIENGPGCGLRIQGQNIVDIFMRDCKIENNEYAMDYLLDVDNASGIFIDKMWLWSSPYRQSKMEYSITTAGTTLSSLLSANLATFTIPGAYQSGITGTATAGSPIITNIADTSAMFVGQSVEGVVPWNYLGTYIKSIDSANQITITENAQTSGTKTMEFKIYWNFGVFYIRQMFPGLHMIAYDTTDPRNYATLRVVDYVQSTGVVTLHVLYVFGNTSKSITSWKLASCTPGLARFGGDVGSNFVCNFIGGYSFGNPVENQPYLHSFVFLDGVANYKGDTHAVGGTRYLPLNSFQGMRSSSSVLLGTGSKTFTIQTGLPADYFTVNSTVYISVYSDSQAQNQMVGTVTSYDSGTGALVVNITSTSGAGTFSSWSIASTTQPLHLTTGTNTNVSVTEASSPYSAPASMVGKYSLTTDFLDTENRFKKQQYVNQSILVDDTSITWNVSNNQSATVTLTGNRTLANPTNAKAGATYILRVVQDATGSRTLAFGTQYKWPNGVTPVLSTSANAVDLFAFYYDGTNMLGAVQNNMS